MENVDVIIGVPEEFHLLFSFPRNSRESDRYDVAINKIKVQKENNSNNKLVGEKVQENIAIVFLAW